jgi:hypothetical protein
MLSASGAFAPVQSAIPAFSSRPTILTSIGVPVRRLACCKSLLHREAKISDPVQQIATPPRLLAEALDYASLRDGLRARARAIGISRSEIDHVGRLPDGHAGGLLAENSNRSLGIRSLGKIMKALGVRLLLVEDPETTARTARLMGRRRSEPQAVEGERHWRSKSKLPAEPMRAAAHKRKGDGKGTRPASVSELGQRGARALNASMTAAERSAAARRAASARWAKPAHGVGA